MWCWYGVDDVGIPARSSTQQSSHILMYARRVQKPHDIALVLPYSTGDAAFVWLASSKF